VFVVPKSKRVVVPESTVDDMVGWWSCVVVERRVVSSTRCGGIHSFFFGMFGKGRETMAREGLQLRDDIKFFGEIFSVDKRTMEKVIQGLYSHHP